VLRFVEHFLGLVGEVAGKVSPQPLLRNTWGDGLYFVLENARQAGLLALDLCDSIAAADWKRKDLPDLNLRIGLHAGPVYWVKQNPVTQRDDFVGAHVSRAARIEPIAPKGGVYASEQFAALAAVEGVDEFTCDYVGQTPMAKGYGVFPTYVVRRRNATPLTTCVLPT
jgi:class 3 adenylate cyclase